MGWMLPTAIGAGSALSFLGGLLEDTPEQQKFEGRAYPKQKTIASMLAPYLWENVDIGLTEKEKQIYRGGARTSVDQALKASESTALKTAASQGLRGGTVSDIISNVYAEKPKAYAGIESNIMQQDVARKQQRIGDILGFLSLSTYKSGGKQALYEAPVDPTVLEEGPYTSVEASQTQTIQDIINEEIAKQQANFEAKKEKKKPIAPYWAGDYIGGQYRVSP